LHIKNSNIYSQHKRPTSHFDFTTLDNKMICKNIAISDHCYKEGGKLVIN